MTAAWVWCLQLAAQWINKRCYELTGSCRGSLKGLISKVKAFQMCRFIVKSLQRISGKVSVLKVLKFWPAGLSLFKVEWMLFTWKMSAISACKFTRFVLALALGSNHYVYHSEQPHLRGCFIFIIFWRFQSPPTVPAWHVCIHTYTL